MTIYREKKVKNKKKKIAHDEKTKPHYKFQKKYCVKN